MEQCLSLKIVLEYQNEQLTRIFSKKKKISMEESQVLFTELKKWLWFLGQRKIGSPPFPSFPEQSIIDDYWHEFILSTMDYHDFCNKYIGRYIHHVPTPEGYIENGEYFGVNVSLFDGDREKYLSKKLRILADSMKEVYEILGGDTVELWYREFPRKYYFKNRQQQL